ncbi:hypothetical protein I2I05_18935 [Hymenobacter sp. BT683]|uniref:Uncharacterized protein n=1 Tax=Hymenobacter jeongseonensis TaxID=2791027 RepID=A0ABS0IM81_9BACT|nr:hypothetical protein [Hymenobacter jeongseonensis]MBF9239476.1 hypothetical protein [Hymenobacter jeongseonensis]
MLPVISIPPSECFNIGGLRGLRVWPAGNVRGYAEPVASVVATELDLFDPANFADIYFLDESASYDEDPEQNEQGDFYKVKLQLLVAGDAPDVSEAVARLTGGRYLAAFLDGNGRTKLAGTPEWPLKLLIGTETGRKPTDRNALPFTFTGVLPARAPFFLEQELLPADARRAWSAGFSFGFS